MWRGGIKRVPKAFGTVHADYAAALKRAPLDGYTRRAYDSRVRTLRAWLETSGLDDDPLTDARDGDFAVRDYKTHMKTVLHRASNTVNAHLTALDRFFTQLRLVPAVVRRDDAPSTPLAPWTPASRSGTCAPLNAARWPATAPSAGCCFTPVSGSPSSPPWTTTSALRPEGQVIVRSGKGETSREILLLDGTARAAVTEWRTVRVAWPGAASKPALVFNRRGGRLSPRAVDPDHRRTRRRRRHPRRRGALALSAHILRHTLATNLLRAGADIVGAELLGHTRLDTIRRYLDAERQALQDVVQELDGGSSTWPAASLWVPAR
ncbi:tyrosine-type recombinase/integrase [Actinomadura physcomitrii]|uniref:tyrosine-type recombinase/integrase n=1 Tax=Actinomadura physcomitrii TaxID=2650748 RepID=UPI001920E228|nr:tyrosine-type recombinase/integrase [Actinomadura physcomitrii]